MPWYLRSALCIPSSLSSPYFCAALIFAIITSSMTLTPSSSRKRRFMAIASIITRYSRERTGICTPYHLSHPGDTAALLIQIHMYVASGYIPSGHAWLQVLAPDVGSPYHSGTQSRLSMTFWGRRSGLTLQREMYITSGIVVGPTKFGVQEGP
ncbi:hypothetical protein HBI56_095100 [Parastagonospora nodorum]|uniref:Uncharacterized protein n=1 Tax=Phaeosphaeria nodorum (strain SN15 / ATCC MYA-4574 / FGSC 10173) TaxID=321614 RepID=A0A7U2I385_PHANO|nr:hypothetical protein HBH56_090390 [Parastagonospora nodorum]QRC98221.1 hypothetical protein JI435_303100 [Parastagonospora nodorum SN15]KAH3936201.1 hypothetical protein HBH54_025030 [Parastagonospora nodorum]KAH3945744.1 hypothetical protein HBH53_142130 [Parastagonospora nodorum]KAH3966366.1 hypothetical protein HBH51_143230 [Parastagonospora nodorum]